VLLFLCCHPVLPVASQIALTLRAVGGLTTAQVARAFLTSEQTMTRRITRAKQAVSDAGAKFQMPSASELPTGSRLFSTCSTGSSMRDMQRRRDPACTASS
jgi:predicted RNA polymerase sigma factor